jgi:hypothetical protein
MGRWGDGEMGRFSLGTVRPALDTQPSVLTALAVAIDLNASGEPTSTRVGEIWLEQVGSLKEESSPF